MNSSSAPMMSSVKYPRPLTLVTELLCTSGCLRSISGSALMIPTVCVNSRPASRCLAASWSIPVWMYAIARLTSLRYRTPIGVAPE